jgi:hypothetical protein
MDRQRVETGDYVKVGEVVGVVERIEGDVFYLKDAVYRGSYRDGCPASPQPYPADRRYRYPNVYIIKKRA